MGLLKRLQASLENVLSQADDPAERIRALVLDLKKRQADGRRALGMAVALEKHLLDDVVLAEDELAAWEGVAKEALEKRDEAVAAEAAGKALAAKARLTERVERHAEQKALAGKVRLAVLEAARRTHEVAHAKSVLLARARCAEAMQSITASLAVITSPEVQVATERMRAAVEAKENQASAT